MFTLYHDLTSSLANPSQRHAMLVHFPIVLSMLAMFALIMLAISRGKSSRWRITTLALLILGMIFTTLAANAGESAVEQLSLPLTTQAAAALEVHEEAAESLWIFFSITAVLVVPTFFKMMIVRYPAVALSTIAGLALLLRVTIVAHAGGNLVYNHGVGVPASPNNVEMKPEFSDK